MDLAGHQKFRDAGARADAHPGNAVGRALLARAWAALASARAESVDLQLRSGSQVKGVLDLRVEGAIAEASTRRGEWTHAFALDDVALVRCNLRGQPREGG